MGGAGGRAGRDGVAGPGVRSLLRFACDEMLGRLARLLRAAGYDTSLAEPGTPDREVLARARTEGRLLLTRDRHLAETAAPDSVLVSADDPDQQAVAIGRAHGLDWLYAPFSRCLMDNTLLRCASEAEIATMPEAARGRDGAFHACPSCGRLYWPGSHTDRLRRCLSLLAAGTEAA